MIVRFLLGVFVTVFLFVSVGLAQPRPGSATDQATLPPEKPDPSDPSNAQMDDLLKRVAATENEVKSQKAQNTELKAQNAELKEKVEKLSGRMDEADKEEETSLLSMGTDEFKQRLDIYGFLDIDFFYYDFEKDELTSVLTPSKPSFTVNHLNVYLSGQMERNLSVLAEIRFAFLPNGNDISYGIPALGTKYSRSNTETLATYDWQNIITHSVAIERAVVTWTPYDFFGIIAGRFITPFGIWVADHSPTVAIPARLPSLITIGVLPLAQTGVELFGRVFPLSGTYFDYALTLSNGRGPTEALFDLDNNKALGLRLKGSYETENFNVSGGGYLYWGRYTDVSKEVPVDGSATSAIDLSVIPTERYKELSGSLDLTVEVYRLRFQAEYCIQQRKYSVRPLIKFVVINAADPRGGYIPDSVSWFAYGLLAYKIPLRLAGQEMEITPFTLYEYDRVYYYYPKVKYSGIRFGLNFKPSPFVAIKYESLSLRLDTAAIPAVNPALVTKYWVHSAQVAVSF